MHKYLRSIGFKDIQTEKDVDTLLTKIEGESFENARRYVDDKGQMFLEIRAEVASGIGVCIIGVLDEPKDRRKKAKFKRLGYYPYATSKDVSSACVAEMFHRVNDETLSGILEDPRVGVTLIFLLDNPFNYYLEVGDGNSPVATSTKLVGFSNNGRILLPSRPMTERKPEETPVENNTIDLMEALKAGDHVAIEQAAIAEMSTIAELGKRLQKEDIYSIVESVFMPQGIECDTYQIIGEILDVDYKENNITGEGIYDLTINVNGLKLHVITSEEDLEGEADVGRRFKGTIWLIGSVDY